jgi:hypothetical protein
MKSLLQILLLSIFIPIFGNAQDEKPQAIERACPSIFSFNKIKHILFDMPATTQSQSKTKKLSI